jgi:hypothetical protein
MSSRGSAAVFLLVLLAVPALLAGQQEDHRSAAIKTEKGLLLVWNELDNYYTLEINGKDARQLSDEQVHFMVDNSFLQIVTVEIKEFLSGKRRKLDDRAILTAHQKWEGKYLEESNKSKLQFETSWNKLDNGSDVLLWSFKLPDSVRENVTEQIYLTLIKRDHVLLLSTPLTAESDKNAAWALLFRVADSLKTSDKPIDLKALQDAMRKQAAAQ